MKLNFSKFNRINNINMKNTRKFIHYSLFVFLLLITLLTSCSHNRFPGFEKTDTGLYYKFYTQTTDTAHVAYEQVVKLRMKKYLNDSILDNTDTKFPNGINQYIREGAFKGAIEEGIQMMAEGDSASFLVSTDSIDKYYPPQDSAQRFPKNSYLTFNVKLLDILSSEDLKKEDERLRADFIQSRKEKEPLEMRTYIQDNHIDAKPDVHGMYLIEVKKGTGQSPKAGDSVIVNYTGTFLNGTVFDSSVKRNEPFGFVMGKEQVIEGWEQALRLMKEGATATIILPSSLGYDSTGFLDQKTGKYFISPYSPLKFQIELLKIKRNK